MILVIAEKPNVARKIAMALAEVKPIKKTLFGVPYYELIRDGKRLIVASAVGHLYGLAPKNDFFGYPIFDVEWVPVYIAEKGKEYAKDYIKLLSVLSKRVREFIVACDYDTEGEVIGYTALKYACGVDPGVAKRMKFSALTKRDLIKAWYNLEPTINFGMANAGIARHILDWYWGVNLSRALTHAIKRASGKWVVLSTGRVQGPTLKFLVDREREIQSFVPQPYWVIKLIFEKNGKKYTANYEKDKIWDENEAKRIVLEVKKAPARVTNIEVKQQNRNPPVPFDLGTLQREAYSAFGFSPKKTLDIAQSLYEKGFCLHPDTLILTSQGVRKIKELSREGEVFALDFNLKLSKAKYRLLERDADEQMYKVTLLDGTELYLTADHPVLVYREGNLAFVPADKLRETDHVVLVLNKSARDNYGFLDLLLEITDSQEDYAILENGETLSLHSLKMLVERGEIKDIAVVGFSHNNFGKVMLRDELWYLIGYLAGKGGEIKGNGVVISSRTKEIVGLTKSLNIDLIETEEGIVLSNKSFVRLLHLIHYTPRVPEVYGIINNTEWLKAFLAGYYDATLLEGLTLEALYKIKVYLQLLGIRAKIEDNKLKVHLEDLQRFRELLGKFSRRKLYVETSQVPVFTDFDERSYDFPRILGGDIYIIGIKSIEKFHYKGKVYDLVVENYHNFIANGIAVHNCSYPRTESQKLPKNLNYKFIIQNLARIPEYRPYAHILLGMPELKPVEGKKEDPAHPAIYPTGEIPRPGDLTKDEALLYDMIVRRFLAVFMEPAVRETVKVTISAGKHKFFISGGRTVKEGWLRVYGKYVKFDEVTLPTFFIGERIKVLQVKREKKKTKPPARYSPAAVIKKMEDLGLGTKATRAQILETLYQRGYIEGKKSIKVTPLGMKVIETLEKYVPEIISVELTREFEKKMELIMEGKLTKEEVIEEAKIRLTKILEEFKKKELEIGLELAKIVVGEEKPPLIVGKCPKCGGDLIVKYNEKTGKRFVGCSNWPKCNVTYPILQRGEIIPTNKTCCNGAPVVIIREKDGREWEICLDMNCKEYNTIKKKR